MQHVRVDHDPQRQLLQVRELRDDQRLRLKKTQGLRNQAQGLVKEAGKRDKAGLRARLFHFLAGGV